MLGAQLLLPRASKRDRVRQALSAPYTSSDIDLPQYGACERMKKKKNSFPNRFQTEDEKNTKMDRCAFHALCNMLKRLERLEPSRNMGVEEMVAMFLHIIAHDVKIRVIKRQFVRSEETISRRFND
ncbi:hypothetical protein HN51_065576, partial [Arachis hypogaea]